MIEEKEKILAIIAEEDLPKEEESKEKKRVKNLFAFIFPNFPMIQI